jgi:diadenosine tetraphosphate (Ap4A) HIT family hydrolase
MEEFVNLNNARHDSQREVMETINDNQECPFCPDHLEKYHKEPIFRKGAHWVLTRNQWPYDHTETHLLAIAQYHAERLSDLQEGSFQELQEHFTWAEKEFNVESGGLAMRFGSIALNGATVNHLHAHMIVPSKDRAPDEKVRFKIS